MDALTDILVILGMFFLRLGVPLLLVFGVGYLLRRLDARWEAEAREQIGTGARQAQQQPRPGQRPAPTLPQRLPAAPAGAYASVIDIFGQPCWEINACDDATKEHCPAYHQPGSPCWLARYQAEGHLPDTCQQCAIYAATSGAALSAATKQTGADQPQGRWLQ